MLALKAALAVSRTSSNAVRNQSGLFQDSVLRPFVCFTQYICVFFIIIIFFIMASIPGGAWPSENNPGAFIIQSVYYL